MHIQHRSNLSTKTMLNAVAVSIIALDTYGMVGVWTQTVGFHHRWEFWLYQVWYGLMVCPWWSYSQTMVGFPSPKSKGGALLIKKFHHHAHSNYRETCADLRGHTSRQRVPLLLPLQYNRQSLFLCWSRHLRCHHRYHGVAQQLRTFLLPYGYECRQFRHHIFLRRLEEESGGARGLPER